MKLSPFQREILRRLAEFYDANDVRYNGISLPELHRTVTKRILVDGGLILAQAPTYGLEWHYITDKGRAALKEAK